MKTDSRSIWSTPNLTSLNDKLEDVELTFGAGTDGAAQDPPTS